MYILDYFKPDIPNLYSSIIEYEEVCFYILRVLILFHLITLGNISVLNEFFSHKFRIRSSIQLCKPFCNFLNYI